MKKQSLVLFGTSLFVTLMNVASAHSAVYADRMFAFANQTLHVGDQLYSADAKYRMEMQWDCNLVIYVAKTVGQERPIWDTKTQNMGSNCRASMQTDGNLVVYDGNGNAVFNTGTQGNLNAVLVMQTDGNLVIYRNYRLQNAIWNSGSQQR